MRHTTAIRALSAIKRRSFVNTAVQRASDRPGTPIPASPPNDDYYALLLANPAPEPSRASINPRRAPKASNLSSSSSVPLPSTATTSSKAPSENRIIFSAPLAGPSARMRGLSRGEQGLGRPPEPDNCCMSGCVNCVWDAYREEVEEWAAARRKKEIELKQGTPRIIKSATKPERPKHVEEGSVGDSDEVGGLGAYDGIDLDEEGGLFEGVPVGIKEFMKQEKRIRERRAREND